MKAEVSLYLFCMVYVSVAPYVLWCSCGRQDSLGYLFYSSCLPGVGFLYCLSCVCQAGWPVGFLFPSCLRCPRVNRCVLLRLPGFVDFEDPKSAPSAFTEVLSPKTIFPALIFTFINRIGISQVLLDSLYCFLRIVCLFTFSSPLFSSVVILCVPLLQRKLEFQFGFLVLPPIMM